MIRCSYLSAIYNLEVSCNLETMQLSGIATLDSSNIDLVTIMNDRIEVGKAIPVYTLCFNYGSVEHELMFSIRSKAIDPSGKLLLYLDVISLTQDIAKEYTALEEYYVNGYCDNRKTNGYIEFYSSEAIKTTIHSKLNDIVIQSPERSLICFGNRTMTFELSGTTVVVYSNKICELKNSFTILYLNQIPDEESRLMIRDLISLYMGRHLILIGQAGFDNGEFRYGKMNSAFRYKTEIDSDIWSPIPPDVSLHDFMSQVWSNYNRTYRDYNLRLFFDAYWRALSMEVDVSMTQLVMCLEHLSNQYSKMNIIPNPPIDGRTYRDLIKDEKNSISKKLESYPGTSYILNNIDNASKIGKHEMMRQFVSSLGVDFDSHRKKAYTSAMNLKHAEYPKSTDRLMLDYTILLNYIDEVVLRLIGYRGEIDDWKQLRDGLISN